MNSLSCGGGPVAQRIERRYDEFGGCGFESHQDHACEEASPRQRGFFHCVKNQLFKALCILGKSAKREAKPCWLLRARIHSL